ncbi:prolyl oligopeptidase family serine peptidase [Pseudomonadota bacterium]
MINPCGWILTSLIALLFQVQAVSAAGLEGTPVQTGEFSTSATILELLGEPSSAYAPLIPIDEAIHWQVYVPSGYDPTKPAGLLVYISPADSGRILSEWKSLMDERNLIWIAADDSGNRRAGVHRMILAVMATTVIERQYQIDRTRFYVSGFSGGGRMASMVAAEYPELFRGAIYICGVNYWLNKSSVEIDKVKRNRYVFLTGSEDFNLQDTRKVFRRYEKAGIPEINLVVIPHMGHRNPGAKDYGKAIAWLDGVSAN